MALITTTEYQTYAGLTVAADGRIDTLIAMAQSALQRITGRLFEYNAQHEEYVSGEDADSIQLSGYPLGVIAKLYLVNPDDDVLIDYDASGYTVNSQTGVIKLYQSIDGMVIDEEAGLPRPVRGGQLRVFPAGFENIFVQHAGGYSPGSPVVIESVPDDLKQAMFDLVDWRRARRGSDPMLTGERLGQYGYDRSASDASTNWNVFLAQTAAPWMKGSSG